MTQVNSGGGPYSLSPRALFPWIHIWFILYINNHFVHENKQIVVRLLENVLFRIQNPPSKKNPAITIDETIENTIPMRIQKHGVVLVLLFLIFCVPCCFCRWGTFMTTPRSIFLSRKYMYTSFGMFNRKPVKPLEGHLVRNLCRQYFLVKSPEMLSFVVPNFIRSTTK